MSEPEIYPDFESAEAALARGETVRIEVQPFKIDPWLVQTALDLQAKERLEEWRSAQEQEESSDDLALIYSDETEQTLAVCQRQEVEQTLARVCQESGCTEQSLVVLPCRSFGPGWYQLLTSY